MKIKHDTLGLSIIIIVITGFFHNFFTEGHIVFSDLSFGISSDRYFDNIFGLWNPQLSTPTLFNIPRFFYVLPFWIISRFFEDSGSVLVKSLILGTLYISGFSMYALIRKFTNVYFEEEINYLSTTILGLAALYYALNPWVIIRIQHIFLLCGYSLFPLLILIFFNIFDPKFKVKSKSIFEYKKINIDYYTLINIFLFGIVFSINSAAIHYFFYEFIFFILMGSLLFIKYTYKFYKKKKINVFLSNYFFKSFLIGITSFLFCLYWLGIYILTILFKTQVSQNNINAMETFGMFSKYSSFKHVIYMNSYWWPMINLEELPIYFYVGGGILFAFMIYGISARGYQDNIILFMTVTSSMFLILGTGIKYKYIEELFILATKLPIFGNIFRDPNKFAGIAVMGMTIILAFGLRSFFNRKTESLKEVLLELGILIGVFFSLGMYIYPYYQLYINGFYHPVKIPEEYQILQDITNRNKGLEKHFYLPIADSMTYSYTGFATPYWNFTPDGRPKATGDFQIYSSQKDTIFHYEGNIDNITNYLYYVQHLLDWGYSDRVGEILKILPVDYLTYHNQYYGQNQRQDFNLQILRKDKNLEERFADRIFTTFKLKEKGEYLSLLSKKVLTPYGFSKLDGYSTYDNFDFTSYGVFFTNGQKYNEDFFSLENDYIETINFNDLYLSSLPEKFYVNPFNYINTADVFLNWGKVSVKNEDWKWYLKIHGIDNYQYDLDKNMGVATTITSSRLSFPSYNIDKYPGKLVYDLETFLRKDIFFQPDNPNIVSIQGYPRSNINEIPVITSKILDGNPNNVWQIAKTGFLEAKENVLYNFNLIISGKGVDRLHLKVRFFDENEEELGITYVSAPTNEFSYTEMNFTGRYISPPKTKYMRIDLLSFENITQKSYWWIHDFIIVSYEDYMEENILKIDKNINQKGIYNYYMRVFKSPAGGILKINIQGKEYYIDTKTTTKSSFEWVKIDKFNFDKGNLEIILKSMEGFNSLSYMVLIDEKDEIYYRDKLEKLIDKNNLFIHLEGENDFEYKGNIQTLRSYPMLSGGEGIRSQEGILSSNIEILKESNYNLKLKMEAIPDVNDNLTLTIINEENKTIYEKKIESKEFINRNRENKIMVDYDIYNEVFQRVYKEKFEILQNYRDYDLNNIFLEKGKYTIKLKFNSKIPSVMKLENLHKMNPDEIIIEKFEQIPFQEDCSECEFINENMFQLDLKKDMLRVNYDPTCSCDWYIVASEKVPVKYDEEYLFRLSAKSEIVRKRHMKVYFLDKTHRFLGTAFIYEVEEQKKKEWNDYEQLIRIPKDTAYMQLQIWARGDKKKYGYLELKNYEVIPYDSMILLDSLLIYENYFEKIEKNNNFKILFNNPMEKLVYGTTAKNGDILTYGESPAAIWEDGDKKRLNKYINGIRPYTKAKNFREIKFKIVLKNFFNIGFIVFAVGFIGFVVMIIYNKRKDGKK